MNTVESIESQVSGGQVPQAGSGVAAPVGWGEAVRAAWDVLRLPVRIIALGLAVFLLTWLAARYLPIADLGKLTAAVSGDRMLNTVVAILVCGVGLSFAIFLWWVVDRYFMLISKVGPNGLSSMQSLPMGLPEGTIRSILALIVAVVGLPILLLSKVMELDPAIAGYVNGIITGVFGFYFGTRSASAQGQALDKVADAQARAQQAQGERDAAHAEAVSARQDAAVAKADAATAQSQAGFEATLSKVARQTGIASTVLDVLVPALPPGMLPSGLASAVSAARTALDSVKAVTKDTATPGHLQTLENVGSALTSVLQGGSNSVLGSLLSKAAPMLSMAGLSGVTPVSALVMLLSVGARLGAAEYQRWKARVLAAPLATGLIEFGTVTPDDARAALLDAPAFARAFAEERARPGFYADLADAVLRDDAIDRLWERYGGGTPGHPPLFSDRAQLQAGLLEFQQALLASRSTKDVPDALPGTLGASLEKASNPAFRPGPLDRDGVNQIIDAASKASASSTVPAEAHAAFDALVTLVGQARQNNVDIVKAISEVAP